MEAIASTTHSAFAKTASQLFRCGAPGFRAAEFDSADYAGRQSCYFPLHIL